MRRKGNWMLSGLVPVALVSLGFYLSASAQVQTSTETTKGTATHEVQVERGEVAYVSGNDLVVKMADGTLRHFPNVPESARVTVDGKELGIHDLKPGMHLQRTITTTTTPKVVTTTQTVSGRIWQITPPSSVILTLEDGTNQRFTIPRGQKFNVDGKMVDAWGLRKGMRINATRVVEEPITQVQQQAKVTGTMPPPPPAPPADVPIIVAVLTPAPAPAAPAAAPEAAPKALPKTASQFPLIGLLGVISLFLMAGVRLVNKNLIG